MDYILARTHEKTVSHLTMISQYKDNPDDSLVIRIKRKRERNRAKVALRNIERWRLETIEEVKQEKWLKKAMQI